MIEQTLKSNIQTFSTDNVQIVYNIIFNNALYSLECFKVGGDKSDKNKYCYIEDVTDDEGEAEAFLRLMVKGKVFPIHMKDMAEDYFED